MRWDWPPPPLKILKKDLSHRPSITFVRFKYKFWFWILRIYLKHFIQKKKSKTSWLPSLRKLYIQSSYPPSKPHHTTFSHQNLSQQFWKSFYYKEIASQNMVDTSRCVYIYIQALHYVQSASTKGTRDRKPTQYIWFFYT